MFPVDKLAKLDDMINRPRWVVPVLPDGELEILLKSAIQLSAKGKINHIIHFKRQCNEGCKEFQNSSGNIPYF